MKKNLTESFNFFLPAEVVKAKGEDGEDRRWIQGIASTDHLDLQGEVVSPKGIEYDYFLKYGYINDDHKPGPEHKVGEPVEAKITKDGFWIKAFLYKGKERADFWWEHLNALEQSDSKRRVGFSIQGKVKRRDGHKIEKCWLQDVAITASPVNVKTWAEIAKSLSAEEWADGSYKSISLCNNPNCGDDCMDCKALMAGGMGQSLMPESLEGSAKIQVYKSLADVPDGISLPHEEYVKILQLEKGWSRTTAEAVVDAIFIEKGIRRRTY